MDVVLFKVMYLLEFGEIFKTKVIYVADTQKENYYIGILIFKIDIKDVGSMFAQI